MKRANITVPCVDATCPDCGGVITGQDGSMVLDVFDTNDKYQCEDCKNWYGLPLIVYRDIKSGEL